MRDARGSLVCEWGKRSWYSSFWDWLLQKGKEGQKQTPQSTEKKKFRKKQKETHIAHKKQDQKCSKSYCNATGGGDRSGRMNQQTKKVNRASG